MAAVAAALCFAGAARAQTLSRSPSSQTILGDASATVTWTISNWNWSFASRTITFSRGGSPNTGWSESCQDDFGTAVFEFGEVRTVTCTYTFSSPGTYSFTGTIRSSGGTSSSTATIQVVSAEAALDHGLVVVGRPTTLTITNNSGSSITRVDVVNAFPGGLTVDAASATNGLSVSWRRTNTARAVFTGTLRSGTSSTLSITYSGPTSRSATELTVAVTARSWTGSKTIPSVPLVVPLSNVSNLSILSRGTKQHLDWTNVSDNGSTHDGVVIFRTPTGTVPPTPEDFRAYVAGTDAAVVFADGPGGTAEWYEETGEGSFNYRVCNRDANYVYSDCDTGFWNLQGWLDSALPPPGGWTRQLGLSALDMIGVFPGGHSAVASNQPSLSVLDLETGARFGTPVTLGALPAVSTAGTVLPAPDGRAIAFAADEQGTITAVNVATGALAWPQVKLPSESFSAGTTGIIRSACGSVFQGLYSSDLLIAVSSADSGDIVGVDAANGGVPLWTLSTGSPISALPTYDVVWNLLFVPTSAGVLAYDMGTLPPQQKAGWSVPGSYGVQCVRTTSASYIACVDRSGDLRVIDKATGAVQGSPYPTGVSTPTSLTRMSAGTPGFVVGNASTVVRVKSDAAFTTLEEAGRWAPGLTLSPVLGFSANGYLIVSASDQRLYKLSSEKAEYVSSTDPVASRDPTTEVGYPTFDAMHGQFLFGTGEGRVFAVKAF